MIKGQGHWQLLCAGITHRTRSLFKTNFLFCDNLNSLLPKSYRLCRRTVQKKKETPIFMEVIVSKAKATGNLLKQMCLCCDKLSSRSKVKVTLFLTNYRTITVFSSNNYKHMTSIRVLCTKTVLV